jgi:hypothetical protein
MKNANANQIHNILAGGTAESPVYIAAESVSIVNPKEIAAAGNALGALAFNVLAGMVDPAFLDKGGLDIFPRSLKNDKSAFKFLLDCKADTIREAWQNEQLTRKRYAAPTLQALAKAVKNEGKESGEMKKSVAQQVADILKGKGTAAKKLEAIAELEAIAKILEGDAA